MTLEPSDSTVEASSIEPASTKTATIEKRTKDKIIAVGANLVVTAPVNVQRKNRTPSISDISARSSETQKPKQRGKLRSTFAFSTVAVFMAAFALPAVASGTNIFVDNSDTYSLMQTREADREAVDSLAITPNIQTTRDAYKGFNELANAYRGGGLATGYSNPNGAVRWPFPYPVSLSANYGPRSLSWCIECGEYHWGIDMVPGLGTPVQAIAEGVVIIAESRDWGLGTNVAIEHVINGERVISVYGHMLRGSLQVKKGDHVEPGQIIGKVGRTGWASGPHLHFEIKIGGHNVDPYPWMKQNVTPF